MSNHFTFFSVALVHFSDQNWNSLNYLFNLHIIVSLVYIKKAFSYLFDQVANALNHPCKWLCTILCSFLHYQLLSNVMLIKMYCNGSLSNSLTPQHLGFSSLHVFTFKMVEQVVIICQAYFYAFPLEDICCDVDENLWPNRWECQEV